MSHRTFTDRGGRVWQVWQVYPAFTERRAKRSDVPVKQERRRHRESRANLPEGFRDGWLAFEWRTERRRLAPTPIGWEAMSDDQLAELVERAVSKAKPRRLIE